MLVRRRTPFVLLVLVTGCTPPQSDAAAEPENSVEVALRQDANEPEITNTGTARYVRQEELQAPFGRVLIGEYGYADGDVGHPTPGRLDISYLVDGQPRRNFRKAVEVGSMGRMAEWDVTYKFTNYPVIYASGGFTNMGITEGCTILTELRLEGPRAIAMIPDHMSNDGAMDYDTGNPAEPVEIEGKIKSIVKGRSFKVVYHGSEQGEVVYRWSGQRFDPVGTPFMEHCNFE